MLLCDSSALSIPALVRRCFNPCSLGCCSVTDLIALMVATQSTGFNPCSLGCCSVTCRSPTRISISCCFNPCSLGCCSVTVIYSTASGEHIMFQSLFSWMLLCDGSWRTLFNNLEMFQSLFSWMLLCDVLPNLFPQVTVAVSILVLLDVAL